MAIIFTKGRKLLDTNLFLSIGSAENEFTEAEQLHQAIVVLSTNQTAADVLLCALRDAAVNHEIQWQLVEDMPEFKACYKDRDKAREDYISIKLARTSTER